MGVLRKDFQREETPPRTWGRRSANAFKVAFYRNTPTHVGKTAGRVEALFPCQKHPHARGEDAEETIQNLLAEETPPRTWGRLLLKEGQLLFHRNTPTHVGKTFYQ